MSKRTTTIVLAVVVAAAVAIVFLRSRDQKVKAAKRNPEILKVLTKEDLALVMKSRGVTDPGKTDEILNNETTRKTFLRGLKEYLSLAARAKNEGMADDRNFELNLQAKEKGLLSELYQNKLYLERKQAFAIPKTQIDGVWNDPENEKDFKAEVEALYAVQKTVAENMGSKLGEQPLPQGEGLEKARKAWAKAKILSDMARADAAFMQDRTTQLRLKILEAGVLSTSYLARHWVDKIKATDEEITAYLRSHPEYDLNKKRERAELVLRRAKNGEDFASLVREFSEDRSTKSKGGIYEDMEKGGGLWEEVEAAALALQPGQIADQLVETKDGYHVVQLIDKTITTGADGKETVYLSIRHILLQKRFEDPGARRVISGIPPPFKTPQEIAKTAVEIEKRQKFIDAVIASENISLPDDFGL